MKKIILLVSILLMFTLSAQAKTEEWIDKNYDFTKLKTIVVQLRIENVLFNGIRENEIGETFFTTLKEDLHDKLPKPKYLLISHQQLMENFAKDNNIDLANIENMPADKAEELDNKAVEYAKSHTDALLACHVWVYDLGTSYHEGYYYTLPSQSFSTITTNIGVTGNVTTYGQTLHHKPGGNYPTAYCLTRWDLFDAKTNKPIWSRIDDRARANMDVLQNTKPKDLFRRICKSMSSDLLKQLKVKD